MELHLCVIHTSSSLTSLPNNNDKGNINARHDSWEHRPGGRPMNTMFLQNILGRFYLGMTGTTANVEIVNESNRSVVDGMAASWSEGSCFEIRPSHRQEEVK
jgi:hypothetical protein